MNRQQINFLFLNVGHFLDHYFMLIFATAAALTLSSEWQLSYAQLIPYATPGFIAFGLFAIPSGWLADKWSREGMMSIFFIGIGLGSVLAGLSNSPVQIALSLTIIGIFASIYHPVGLAMVVHGRKNTGMPLAINGVFGNMGVASAALLTGYFIDTVGWRSCFIVSGGLAVAVGILYLLFIRSNGSKAVVAESKPTAWAKVDPTAVSRQMIFRVFGIIFFTTAVGGLIFQSTTFALPKVFEERLTDLAGSATLVGWYTFIVFSVAAMAQLVVGYLVDNYAVKKVFGVVALLQVVFFTLMSNLDGLAALAVSVGFMLAVFGQIPINDVLVGRLAKSEWRSRAYAIRYVVSFSVMAIAVPSIAWLHDGWGFTMLFGVLAFAALLIFIAVFFLPTLVPHKAIEQ